MRPDPNPATQESPESHARSVRPRARRYPFAAGIELTDVQSEEHIHQQTTDLSLFGCRVAAGKIFAPGTKVSVRMARGGLTFHALGRVVRADPKSGMGIAFIEMEKKNQEILEKWMFELRSNHK